MSSEHGDRKGSPLLYTKTGRRRSIVVATLAVVHVGLLNKCLEYH